MSNAQPIPSIDQPFYGIPYREAVKRFFVKYATFSGRASRGEYWHVFGFLFVTNFAINLCMRLIDAELFSWISGLWSIATLVPLLAVSVRRLHDSNKAGWLIVLPMVIGIIGAVVLSVGVFLTLPSLMVSEVPANSGISAIVVGLILLLIALAINVIFMAAKSNPLGARFDRPAQAYDSTSR